ncbi:MAG: AraC family transcriptional regulator [Verrucomicrobiota bacterium]
MKAQFEKVPVDYDSSFHIHNRVLKAFDAPWHFHPEIELTGIVTGEGIRFVGTHHEPYFDGDLVLVGSNVPHYWRTDDDSIRSGKMSHSLVIQFLPDTLGGLWDKAPELASIRNLLARSEAGLKFSGSIVSMIFEKMQFLVTAQETNRLIALLEIFDRLSRWKNTAELSDPRIHTRLDKRASERIDRVYAYIFEHLNQQMSLRELAQVAGMAPSPFCRYFKRITGKNLFEFITLTRLDRVCKRLIENDDSTITEIAFQCGFNTLSHFNQQFRSHLGMSPSRYRSTHQQVPIVGK